MCLLARCYSHAGDIVRLIGDQEVTVDMLTQLDRLVQLFESPIFTFLRMELLDGDNDLISGIMMLLPQSDAFNLVRGRLECIPKISKHDKLREAKKQKRKKFLNEINFPSLLEHPIPWTSFTMSVSILRATSILSLSGGMPLREDLTI